MDVCWQLPLTAFDITSATQTYDIWATHQIEHAYLFDQWGDYCTGSSYTLAYVSGPKLAAGGDPTKIDINKLYKDRNKYNEAAYPLNKPVLEGVIPDITWEGVHTVRIVAQQGTTKKYRVVQGTPFQITYTNPCRRAIVTPGVINNMSNTVGELAVVTQVYSDFPDDISTLYGNGFDKCGVRNHYLT
jgi:hypothetical protein